MSHKHNVYEADPHFSIDSVTKKIKNGSTQKTRLIQGDHNSECFGFDLARYVEGHDMMLCDTVMIHYINVDSATRAENKGVYEVRDLQVNPNDKNKVVFSWTITENVTLYAGPLSFLIKFMCTENGETVYRWNTDINSEISISNGMSNDETITELFPDILAQWHDEIFGDAENAVANINLAEQDALANVTAEGEKQIQDIQTVIEPIQSSVDQIYKNYRNKAAAIEGTAEGETIVIDDSAEQPFIGFQLFGKSEQETNSGSQLFDYSLHSSFNDFYGAKVQNNGDGSFTVSGTGVCTGTTGTVETFTHEQVISMMHVGQLKFAQDVITMPYYYVSGYSNNKRLWTLKAGEESEITQENLDDETFCLEFGVKAIEGEQIVSGTVKPMVYQDGDGTWESFTGGVAIPNPENPSEIVSLENPEVVVCGKNLAYSDVTRETTVNGMTILIEKNKSEVVVNGTSEKLHSYGIVRSAFLPVGKYTISVYGLNVFDTSCDRLYVMNGDTGEVLCNHVQDGRPKTFEITEPLYCRIDMVFAEGGVYDNRIINIQIEKGEVATEFESYKEPQSIQIPYTLHGIPVESGGNYTDSDGQQWVCDEIDLERGVLVQRIFSKTITDYTNAINYSYDGAGTSCAVTIEENVVGYKGMCSHFALSTIAVGNDRFNQIDKTVYFKLDGELTMDEWIEKMTELSPTVLGILSTPIETTLSEAEIEAFKSLLSNYHTTTILNDSGANMAVRYGVDTKTYIDKKFAELMVLHE